MYSGEVISILGSFKFNAYMVMQVLNYVCVDTHTHEKKRKKKTLKLKEKALST